MSCYIEQENLSEPTMTVRTQAHWLVGWYFPGVGGTIAERFRPPNHQRESHGAPFASEWDAVQWITGGTMTATEVIDALAVAGADPLAAAQSVRSGQADGEGSIVAHGIVAFRYTGGGEWEQIPV